MEWISVKDKLPEERIMGVLLFNGDAPEYNQHIFQGMWFNQTKSFSRTKNDYQLLGNITHWMPLPSPPKDLNDQTKG